MSGNEDWRFQKAKDLGLVEDRPMIIGNGGEPPLPPRPEAVFGPLPAREVPASAVLLPPARPAPRPDAAKVPASMIYAGIAGGLALAVGGGWLLRGAIDAPVAVVRPAATPAASVRLPPDITPSLRPAVDPVDDTIIAAPAEAESEWVAPEPAIPPVTEAVVVPLARAQPQRVEPRAKARAAGGLTPQSDAATTPAAIPTTAAPTPSPDPGSIPAALGEPVVLAESPGPVAAGTASPARVDCRRESTKVSRMICADRALRALDEEMTRAYRTAQERRGPEADGRLDREQATFVDARSACKSRRCIGLITERRLSVLYRE